MAGQYSRRRWGSVVGRGPARVPLALARPVPVAMVQQHRLGPGAPRPWAPAATLLANTSPGALSVGVWDKGEVGDGRGSPRGGR